MDLAKDSSNVVDRGQGMDCHYRVEAVSGEEGQLSDISVVNLDMNFSDIGGRAGSVDVDLVGVDGDDSCALSCKCDRGATGSTSQVEHTHTGEIA